MKYLFLLCGMAALSASAQNYTSYNNQPVALPSYLRSRWTGGNIFQDSSLIAYWPMTRAGGTFYDYSGHGITAVFQGSTTGPYGGKIGTYAPYFNKGVPNSATIPTTPSITVPFTVSAWVKVNTPTGGYTRILENDYQKGFYLGLDTTMTKFQFIVDAGSTGSSASLGTCYGGSVTTGSWTTSTWQMVTGVYNGTNAYLYVNGSQVAGPCTFTSPGTTSLPVKIGYCYVASYCSAATGGWDGQLTDIRIYGRALSAAEILAIYTAELH